MEAIPTKVDIGFMKPLADCLENMLFYMDSPGLVLDLKVAAENKLLLLLLAGILVSL